MSRIQCWVGLLGKLEPWKWFLSSEPLQKWTNLLLVRITICIESFLLTMSGALFIWWKNTPKCCTMWNVVILKIFYSLAVIQRTIVDSPGSRFVQTVIRTSSRLDWFLHDAAQNFEVFSNNPKKMKIKKSKTIAVDDLFKAYPMIPLSCRSNLARRYL